MSKNDKETNSSIIRLLKEWIAGGSANAITSGILNPMDVAKTRLQASTIKISLSATIRSIYLTDGIIGLWTPGLFASLTREMVNSGARTGFYGTVRDLINNNGKDKYDNSLFSKIVAAMITGTIGSVLANPIDVIKVRLMADPALYPSTISAFPIIIKSEGLNGLYKGLVPSTLRGAFIAAGELATYDHSKKLLKDYFNMQEGSTLHIFSSLITGLVATTVAAPFDLIKTRSMNSTSSNVTLLSIISHILFNEGPITLFRGWLPAYLRLGPHALLCFPIFEQIRKLIGLDYL